MIVPITLDPQATMPRKVSPGQVEKRRQFRDMVLLTDCPSASDQWLETPPAWQAFHEQNLEEGTRDLWQKVGTSEEGWRAEWPWPEEGAGFEVLTIIDQAPESQFDVLRKWLSSPLSSPRKTACIALRGQGFHGLRDRPWQALKGNLHLSVAFRNSVPCRKVGLGLTVLPAVVVVETVRDLIRKKDVPGAHREASTSDGQSINDESVIAGHQGPPSDLGIKWVNDILLGGRKISGVLTHTAVEGDMIQGVVFGIGLNILVRPEVVPTPFVPMVGCLADRLGQELAAYRRLWLQLLVRLHSEYQQLLDSGPGRLIKSYRWYSLCMNQRVRIWREGVENYSQVSPTACGRVISLGDDLALALESGGDPIRKGRLAFESACQQFGI